MKLLLDENLSRRIVPFIQEAYPGSTQVALLNMEHVNDAIIRQYAIDNDYVIVTKDSDFHDMNTVFGQPPKIIWLRIGNQSKAETIKTLLQNQDAIKQALMNSDNDCIELI